MKIKPTKAKPKKPSRMKAEHEAMRIRLVELEEVGRWHNGPDKGRLYWECSGNLVAGDRNSKREE